MSGPLAGIRIIDMTHALAGPYGTMLLADLGADVIKVESPEGDVTRGLGPYHEEDEERVFGGYFQSINRGKRSIVLDLKTEEGIDTLLALVGEADALVENFSVGVMERLGVPYERLRDINPRLVYASTRGYGDPRTGESPYASWPAFDIVVQAFAGPLGITGNDDGTPIKVGPGVGDIFPGALTALGVVSALLHARNTGEGQYVDVAMYDGMLSLCERIVYQYSYEGVPPKPEGNKHPFLSPFDVVMAKDGWITIAAPTPPRWKKLCELMQRPELIDDERYDTGFKRAARRDEVRAIVSEWTADKTRAEIMEIVGGIVPAAPVNSAADIFADEHAHKREMLIDVPHPGCKRPLTVAGQPIKFTATPAGIQDRAPLLDEHGEEIKAEIAAEGAPSTGWFQEL